MAQSRSHLSYSPMIFAPQKSEHRFGYEILANQIIKVNLPNDFA